MKIHEAHNDDHERERKKFISHHLRQLANQPLVRISIYLAFPLGKYFKLAIYSLLVKESFTF